MREIFIPKIIQDAIDERIEITGEKYQTIEDQFVKCFVIIGRRTKTDPQTVCDRIADGARENVAAFIEGVINS